MSAICGRVCARALGHTLVLACVLLAFAAAEGRAASVPPGFYGVNSGATLVDDPAGRMAAFATMRAGGLSFVRVDASWGGVEPTAPVAGVHTYNWAMYDHFVSDLALSGLRWYPMLGYSAEWASSSARDPFAPPASDADFASYAAAFAGRYGTSGSFWADHPELPKLPTTTYGIWNEPSNPTFWHGPEATPARYMSLYLAARTAIRSADPQARVATAGLLDSGSVDADAYLRAMLDSAPAARGQIDAVGWHPYVGDVGGILASIGRARTTLDRYRLTDVPIEVSEVGWWHTSSTATQRAGWLRHLAATLPYAAMKVTRLMPYVWTGDANWQITDADGSLGQVGGAYIAGIRDALAPPSDVTNTDSASASSNHKLGATRAKTTKKYSARVTKTARRIRAKTARKRTAKSRSAGHYRYLKVGMAERRKPAITQFRVINTRPVTPATTATEP
jgi:hypothetical protein